MKSRSKEKKPSLVRVRVTAEESTISEVVDAVITGANEEGFKMVDQSVPYPPGGNPKYKNSTAWRVYLTFTKDWQ